MTINGILKDYWKWRQGCTYQLLTPCNRLVRKWSGNSYVVQARDGKWLDMDDFRNSWEIHTSVSRWCAVPLNKIEERFGKVQKQKIKVEKHFLINWFFGEEEHE